MKKTYHLSSEEWADGKQSFRRFVGTLVMVSLLLSFMLWLTGCVAIQQEMIQRQQEAEAADSRREAVMHTGASTAEVVGAWGAPDESSAFGGAVHGETLQYGRCATSHSVSHGVIFFTFLNDALSSWYVTQC